ncbi:acyl-CoA dehydrogenase family protein [Oharaeibacter diazotrophicus]|uniref:Alkylation response protein AidB-like acyl-CoA dehydrogenase n=1 Tax=Oharaeibacter diazotrophicus TaxID=1920512 RepID=A0A4R6RGI5_9HYPH|nr:acyl-CoA dehydrogenase family protein [Oharaeibacter diazotrophicus]TDP85420.1 alkylation response protein AidB-like acyl-CoA dehydrogenase [Oharaeibacter diazotrophicus]BBE74390.1 flavin-dependent monooxygenase, oxygenase subunit HsaA [Pleomorphomonas sp. SM30]GLS75914.1 acyl-CoA dehydrogenase [Oharaeibacter diazotrophicus]
MNKPLRHGYWGSGVDHRDLLAKIAEIGPTLEANAPADEDRGELTPDSFAALKQLRMSHALATEALGGMQLPPTQVLELLEAITWWSGSAGWVSMVHCCIGAMSAAFLPDSAVERLFAPGTDNRFSGQGAPLGMLKKVDGGYRLTGRWSYGSGFSHATYSHSAAFVDDGTGKPAKDDAGNVVVMCAHAPIEEHVQLGNWDVLGLGGTGSIDYAADDVFVPDDLVFPILTAPPQRLKELFSLGVVGLAAIGHTGWALGQGRRMLDEIAKFARSKSGRAGMLGESEKFWHDYGRAEARYRAARAFVFEVWRDIEATVETGTAVTTRQISLVHLAKSEIHEAGVEVCNFAYRAGGGASLRAGVIQRTFREMMVAANHFTIAPSVVTQAGRNIGGSWTDRVWQFYDLVEKK